MRIALFTLLSIPILFPASAAADSERWILYGSLYESGSARYRRVNWDNMAMVVFDRTEETGGIQLWTLSGGSVIQLGLTPLESQSARDIERLLRSAPKKWIKGFALGRPGQPGAPSQLEAYGDMDKVKSIWRGSLTDPEGTESFCLSFSEKGDPPLFAVSEERGNWDIQDMIRVSMDPRKPARAKTVPTPVRPGIVQQPVPKATRVNTAQTRPARKRRAWVAKRAPTKVPVKIAKAPAKRAPGAKPAKGAPNKKAAPKALIARLQRQNVKPPRKVANPMLPPEVIARFYKRPTPKARPVAKKPAKPAPKPSSVRRRPGSSIYRR